MPLCFTPPNGADGSETRPRLTPTIPASIRSATRSASPSSPKTYAARPNSVSFTAASSSSVSVQTTIGATGPKISSRSSGESAGTPVRTVGG